MDNFSETSKKKTKRNRRSFGKTKRNFKKKGGGSSNTENSLEKLERDIEKNDDMSPGNNFLQNLFSWF